MPRYQPGASVLPALDSVLVAFWPGNVFHENRVEKSFFMSYDDNSIRADCREGNSRTGNVFQEILSERAIFRASERFS
jgi:hypothetical protein